ncbi:MAG: FdhF/YdeP family oxidoreductase, partial [Planctomycetota bacterium]
MTDSKIEHRPPADDDRLQIHKPKNGAVGLKAVRESIRQMGRYMDMPKALRASLKMNQKGGFDCPGCAWPDPEDERSSVAEYCENGIKALAEEATKFKADPDFFRQHSVVELSRMTDFELGKSGRITHPMHLPEGATHYEEISWEDAFAKVAEHLHSITPDEAIFYTSGRTSNEAAFLYGLMVRAYGTNNLPDCSNMCHESSGRALSQTLGIGKGSVRLSDLYKADLIIVMGQNPGTNHPRMLNALEKCKDNGGKIVAVNPLKEAGLVRYTNPQKPLRVLTGGIELADLHLPVPINADMALTKSLMLKLLEKENQSGQIFDHKFIKELTTGFDEFVADLEQQDLDACIRQSGISESLIDQLAEMIAESKKIIICWAMGLTQQVNGVATIRELVNLLLLKGSVGIEGGGTCPVRGHSNVQGDRTMGIWEKMPEPYFDRLDKAFDISAHRKHGLDTVESIKAMHSGEAKVFLAMGGNFLSAAPDTDFTAQALRNCKLTVHVSTKPNRSHLVHGKEALILPCLGRTEIDIQNSGYQFVSVENSMGVVHSSKGILQPISDQLKSEPAIIAGLASAIFCKSEDVKIDWNQLVSDYDLIREKIEAVIPGFDNYNQRIRVETGFELPNGARTREFTTPDGKAHFTINTLPKEKLKNGQFQLMTVRSHDQYNTTIYGLNDRYRGIEQGRKIVLMNPDDIMQHGFQPNDLVNIYSIHQGKTRSVFNFKIIPYEIPKTCLATYFPEANPLVAIES